MNPSIAAQASQGAAQGQQLLQEQRDKAASATTDFNTFSNKVTDAGNKVQDYTKYMQGEGSAGNQFHGEMDKELGDLGYDPAQMTAARANVNQATGALSAYSDFANTAASKWGMNAGGFAAANSGALSGLNNNIAANQGVVSSLQDLYKTAQTGANNFTGQVISGQHETLAGLQSVYDNASKQRDAAYSMMTFYDDLASKQGGLNAQQQQYYAAAQQAYASSQAAMAQATLYGKQATQAQQQIDQTNAYMGSPAYKAALAGTTNANGQNPSTPTANNGPTMYDHIQSGLADGALNLGRWGWTDTTAKAMNKVKSLF